MLPSGTIGPVGKKTTLSHLTVWGPIPAATAERLGLPSEVESVLIRPTALNVARAAEAVLKIVPPDVLPVEGDTAESLVARLERSDWLDDMEVKKSGQAKEDVGLLAAYTLHIHIYITCYNSIGDIATTFTTST